MIIATTLLTLMESQLPIFDPSELQKLPKLTTESIPSPVFFGSPEESVYWELCTGIQNETPIIDIGLISEYLERKKKERELEVAEFKPLFGS